MFIKWPYQSGVGRCVRADGLSREQGPVKVAFISHTSILGGAERALLELVVGLQSNGVDCLVTMPSAGPLGDAFAQAGVRCAVVKYSWWSNPTHRIRRNCNNALAVFRLAALFRRERVNLVYSNTMMIPSGAVAAKVCGLPHIWHVHEFGQEDHGLRLDVGDRLGISLIGALSAKVICVSQAVEHKLAPDIAKPKLTTIYGTVTLPQGVASRQNGGGSAIRCILVGVLRPSKGQREAIEAIDELIRRGTDIVLTLVGTGPMEQEMRDLVASKETLHNRVEFTGYVENPFPYIESADILLMCSRCEAFARPTLEGMMLGKPIVGSRSGGTVEAVREGINGLLYTPGDVSDLARKIEYLANNRDYARSLGENGREWSRRTFTAEKFVAGVLAQMQSVLQEEHK